ncbi:MAG: ABC transporter ATP-binding protein [Planctomycetota bacterium]|nr:MAG: ABC transporter ATP-binding protein [Planctomycetota bacterium]
MIVSVRGIEKSFIRGTNRMQVLRGIDLDACPGECVFLAGPSGSGKSTLLSILGCILTPDSGTVRLFGTPVEQLDETARAELRRKRIGFVFQRFHLIRGLNALDNVCVPMVLRGVDWHAARRRASELLDRVGLGEHLHADPRRMSAGQCQRIAFARALANDPQLILADEPTASLDGEHGTEAMRLLRALTAEEGKTAIVVTHDARIFGFADRVLWLEDGRIVENREPQSTVLATAEGS